MNAYSLFLLLNLGLFCIETYMYVGNPPHIPNVSCFFLLIFVRCIHLFFITGIYYLFLIQTESNKKLLVELYKGSKQYFLRVLVVSIWIAIVTSFFIFISVFAFKALATTKYSFEFTGKIVIFNVMKNAIDFLVSLFFVYSIPVIYSHDLKDGQAISISFKFLRSHALTSRPIICLLGLSFVIDIIFIQSAMTFGFKSSPYWIIMLSNNIIFNTFSLSVFLAAILVLKDYFDPKYIYNRANP